MDDQNKERLKSERIEALKEFKTQLELYPNRRVGVGDNDWSREWIAQVGQTIIDYLRAGNTDDNIRDDVRYLVNCEAVDFLDRDNQMIQVEAFDWFGLLESEPDIALKVYEKCSRRIPLDVHKTILETILRYVADNKIGRAGPFAADVIRISFSKCEALFEYNFKLSVFDACRRNCFGYRLSDNVSTIAHFFANIWRTLMSRFPKNSPHHTMNMLLGFDPENPSPAYPSPDYLQVQSTEMYILKISLEYKNVFPERMTDERIEYKKAIVNLWGSFDYNNLDALFYPPQEQGSNSLLDKLFRAITSIVSTHFRANDRKRKVFDCLPGLIYKLCDYSRTHRSLKLQRCLESLRRTLLWNEEKDPEKQRMALRINSDSGGSLLRFSHSCENYIWDIMEQRVEEGVLSDVILCAKAIEPHPDRRQLEKVQMLLGYGSEEFQLVWNQELDIKQANLVAKACNCKLGLRYHDLQKRNHDSTPIFGNNELTHENIPHYLNFISSFVMTQIGERLAELKLSEDNRGYLHPSLGFNLFEHAVDTGLTLLLDTMYENLDVLTAHFQVEGANPMEIFNNQLRHLKLTCLRLEELEMFSDGMDNEVKAHLSGTKSNLDSYFVPLVEMVSMSTEVLQFERIREEFFEHFYVPVVRGLLVLHPELAMQLIVAFCRAELRLNVWATNYDDDDNERFKTDWQRIRDLKTPEIAQQYFQNFSETQIDVYSKSASIVDNKTESTLMERFVAAIVKHRNMYNNDATVEYMIVTHYYDILREKGISNVELRKMSDKAVHDILLNQANNID